jgi:hypothetical protein
VTQFDHPEGGLRSTSSGGFRTARRTLAGIQAMAMIGKRQVRNIRGNDIRAQANFIAGPFQMAA